MYAHKDSKNSDQTTSIYQVDANGNAKELAKLPLDPSYNYFAGDVSPDGRYYTIMGNNNSPAIFYEIDLLSGNYSFKKTTIVGVSISSPDIAYSVNGDKLFVEDNDTQQLMEIDLLNGKVAKRYNSNFSGSLLFSGIFGFDCALFGFVRSSGSFIRIETVGKNSPIGTATELNSIQFAQSSGIDACACPQTLKFEKKANKIAATDTCNRDYRFVFQLDNECSYQQTDINFQDILPKDFVIKSIDRQPFGGVIQSGVGSQLLDIQGLTIPEIKDSIVITATLAPVFKDSVFKNQAILKNLKYIDGTIYTQVSDNPFTIKSNDSTVIKAPLRLRFNRDTVSLCENGAIVLKPSAIGKGLQYLWNNGATSDKISIEKEGLYVVTVTSDCFNAIDSQWVIDKPLTLKIGEDAIIFPGDSVFHFAKYTFYNPIVKKEWLATNGTKLKCQNCFNNVAIAFKDQSNVKLRLVDEMGCVAEDDANIFVKRNIYFPNAFSPNDDGLNDRFIIFTEKKAKIALLQIFNRWGDLVYQSENECFTNDYDCAWDGTYRGYLQKIGVFTYRALIDFGDAVLYEYKGDLQLF